MELRFTNWRRLETGEGSAAARAYRAATIDPASVETTAAAGAVPSLEEGPTVKGASDLTEIENRQLVAAFTADAHVDVRLAVVLADPHPFFVGTEDILEHVMGAPFEWWDVVEASSGELRYVWVLWGTDCGRCYVEGSTDVVASISQLSLWCEADPALCKALCRAHRSARAHHPRSDLAGMDFSAYFRCLARGCGGGVSLWKNTDEDQAPCSTCGAPVRPHDHRDAGAR